MKRCLCGCVLAGVLLASAAVCSADWDEGQPYKWLQRPDLSPLGMDICVDDTGPAGQRLIADDFKCDTPEPVTDVHLWGSWKDDIVGQIDSVRLTFWTDNPAGPNGHSEPATLLWEKWFVPGEFTARLYHKMPDGEYEWWWDPRAGGSAATPMGDTEVWQLNFRIDPAEAFFQEGMPDNPIIYWLGVEVKLNPDIQANFGWKTRDRWDGHFLDDAVWYTTPPIPWHALTYPADVSAGP